MPNRMNAVVIQKIVLFLSFLAFSASCSLQKIPTDTPALVFPSNYSSSENSKDEPLQPWKSVFQDATLTNLVDTALVRNFDYRMALQRMESVRAGVVFTQGIRMPDLNFNSGLGLRRFGKYTMDGVGNFDTRRSPNINSKQLIPDPLPDYSLFLSSSWEVDVYGKLKNQKKAAARRYLASEMGKNFVLTQTVATVGQTYYSLLGLDNEVQIYKENIRLQENAVEIVKIQKLTGQVNQLAVEIMEAQLLDFREKLIEIENRSLLVENQLNFLVGSYYKNLNRNLSELERPVSNQIKAGIPSSLLRNRPDIIQAEHELQAAGADVRAAHAAFFPSLNLGLNMGLQAYNAAFLAELPASFAFSGLAGLTAPLLNRRLLKAQLLQANAQQKMAYIQYERSVYQAFSEVFNAIVTLQNIQRRIEIKIREVEILKSSINTAGELFRSGRANYLEVNNAQKNALSSQLELTELKIMRHLAQIELYRALGGGWK